MIKRIYSFIQHFYGTIIIYIIITFYPTNSIGIVKSIYLGKINNIPHNTAI
jgi:hypothetical protein